VRGGTRCWTRTGARARLCLLRSWRRWIRRIAEGSTMNTRLMRGGRLGIANEDGLVRMAVEGGSRGIEKRSANGDGKREDGEGKRRRLRRMLRREMG
jgi:hypothetical protein